LGYRFCPPPSASLVDRQGSILLRRERGTVFERSGYPLGIAPYSYWKYTVRRQITGEKRGAFALDGSNWFPRPDGTARWADERRLLDAEHIALRTAVAALRPADLARTPEGSAHPLAELVAGAAAHDLYHAGQIQLMKRLARERDLRSF
jgi:hypothetical protein